MGLAELLKRAKFGFQIVDSSTDVGVLEFSLEESLSVPYEANLVLTSVDEIPFDSVIGKEGLVTIDGDKADRLVHGIVNRFSRVGKKGKFILYELTLVPQIWLLSQTRNNRIFQNKGIRNIISEILKSANIQSDRFEFRFQENYKPPEYLVQYQETDLDFLSRLLEKEGIWYFFEHTKEKHTLVFADGLSAYKPVEGAELLAFRQGGGMVADEEVVFEFQSQKAVATGKVTQTDFNYLNPSTPLKSEEQEKENNTLEVFEYPGCYEDAETGKRLNKVRLQEKKAGVETGRGSSSSPLLAPGFTFTLKGHDKSECNQPYLITMVSHQGSQPQVLEETATGGGQSYSNSIRVIPAKVTYRPERITPTPVILGPQTAIVVGPSGEEIYTDEQGRIKVKFHWDRADEKNEKSSCWIRVAQLWAGEGWGSVFIPRIGQEVIVSFLDGNPDRPIVIGRVYNGANPPPLGLPDSKTKSTIMSQSSQGGGGSNEITFDDAKGEEQIFIHGQKDLIVNIENDATEVIGNNQNINVKTDQSLSVGQNRTKHVGANESVMVTGSLSENVGGSKNETIGVGSAETVAAAKALSVGGAYQVSVGAGMNETVGAAKGEQVAGVKSVVVGKSMSEKVTGERSMTAGKKHVMKSKEIALDAGDSITIKAGSSFIKISKNGNIDLKGKKISINGKSLLVKSSGKLTIKGKKIAEN